MDREPSRAENTTEEQSLETAADLFRLSAARRPIIHASCPLYICRVCRIKTQWPHQIGCKMMLVTEPDCDDCRYWSVKKGRCDHPEIRKGGDCL